MSFNTGGDVADSGAADALWALEGSHGVWTPECWHKSPEQMQEEARAMNEAAFAQSAAMASKHDNPPAPAGRDRPF